jgi:hypothetical protein
MEWILINTDGTESRISSEDFSVGADTNYIGNLLKTSYNRLGGYTKVDYRPTGGGTNSYALQVRHNVGSTSGAVISLDHESHIVADGTASLRGVQGVAVVDAGKTSTGATLIGTYGQARADGTVAGSAFMAGLYGLIEASAAVTASHVCSAWLDSHQANAVTGSHQLLYMTNNGAAQMDEAIYVYGGDKITSLLALDTVSGMVAATAETGGSSKKIKITIDGVVHYINAYTG